MFVRGGKVLKTVMDANALDDSIMRIARGVENAIDPGREKGICIVGIKTMGEVIAQRVAAFLSERKKCSFPVGVLDITLYRDDIWSANKLPKAGETEMPFSVDGLDVLLVDDVISTGRTVRAAMESLTDYGRPDSIKLAVVADRRGREFPIQPDYCAVKVSADQNQKIVVSLDNQNAEKQGVFITGT